MPTTYGTPPWLLGRDVSVTITPLDVSSTGVYSPNAIGTLVTTARLEEDMFTNAIQTQDYRPVQSFNANPVPVSYSGTYTITEIAQALPLVSVGHTGWGFGNVLEAAFRTSFYHLITVSVYERTATTHYTAASSGSVFSWSFYALMTECKRTSPKQKNTWQATLQTISVGDGSGGFINNPTVT